MFRSLLSCLILTLASLSATAQDTTDPQAAEHDALRQLKAELTQVMERRDFDAAAHLVHTPFMATVNTQDSFTTLPALKDFYDRLFTHNVPRLKEIHMRPEADELSQIYTGTFALTRGMTNERYVLADGRDFDMQGRWTAVSLKEPDGRWKLLGVHMGVNFMNNPVLNAIERSVMWIGLAGAGAGALLGFGLAWWLRRPRR
ncbi:MAG: nuclear transport factor 2 family protein [Pseudomonadota bacterium]|nr:nuclear transport factor 2 family protein [Pseudomonadota bacterium]